ncbi:hypothetical protein AS594_33735 [Streptomyces agglomeratus]|uniref:Insertion element IS402-like domain-containing protein n=1 Tax=Streptomyces agglomeratus TaxID=285458 RepID=A0A1E5PGR9_9ACTN|nr:hypothetical protein AS594_33735 [Streptomyces agglomeratus]OEJ49784.1 hypothetical protein BGK72_02330 [Streptomyces agglomeratus]
MELAEPLLPAARVRPQGGGMANIDDEAVFAAIIYVLVSGCVWRALPPRCHYWLFLPTTASHWRRPQSAAAGTRPWR